MSDQPEEAEEPKELNVIDYFLKSWSEYPPTPTTETPESISFTVLYNFVKIVVRQYFTEYEFICVPCTTQPYSFMLNAFGNSFPCTRGYGQLTTEASADTVLRQLFRLFPTVPLENVIVRMPEGVNDVQPKVEYIAALTNRLCGCMVNSNRQKSCDVFKFSAASNRQEYNVSSFTNILRNIKIKKSLWLNCRVTQIPWTEIELPPAIYSGDQTDACASLFYNKMTLDCEELDLTGVHWSSENLKTFVFDWFIKKRDTRIRKMTVTTRGRHYFQPNVVLQGVQKLCKRISHNSVWELKRPDKVTAKIQVSKRSFSFTIL